MPENLEWKARLPDWDAALRAAERVATAGPEQQTQIDTYFHAARGRLKLRQIQRANSAGWPGTNTAFDFTARTRKGSMSHVPGPALRSVPGHPEVISSNEMPLSESAELIFYERSDDRETKSSHYVRQPLADATSWLALLTAALGSWAVVTKRRTIFWHHNVRIHLDQVEGLGDFLEFEAVLESENDRAASETRLQDLIRAFGLTEPQGIAGSYSDFVAERLRPA